MLIWLAAALFSKCFAQSTRDTLLQKLSISLSNKERVDLLNEIALINVTNEPDSGIYYSKKSVALSQEINYKQGYAYGLFSLGAASWIKGDLSNAFNHLTKSRDLATELNDLDLVARTNSNIGTIYSILGNDDAAISYYKSSLKYHISTNNLRRITILNNNIGRSFLELQEYDSAKYYLEKSLLVARQSFPNLISVRLFNLADNDFRRGIYNQLNGYLTECLLLANQLNDTRSILRANQLLAEVSLINRNIEKADSLSKISVKLAENTNVQELISITYKTRSKVLAELKDFEKAYYYQVKASQYQDSLSKSNTKARIDFFEYEKRQQGILLLQQENVTRRYAVYALTSLLALAILIILFFYITRRLRSKSHKTLLESHEEIQNQAKELEELNATKDKFFAIISHDLRNPINQLKMLSSILNKDLQELRVSDNITKLSNYIELSSNRASSLLEELLTWAQMQSGTISFVPEQILVKDKLETAEQLFRPKAEERGINLIINYEQDLLIRADKKMINTVLRNLLDNAFKFTAEGQITITASKYDTQFALFTVSDTGAGIDPQNINSLFRVDSKVSMPGLKGEKGSGLGLVLCKEFIDKHKGNIWVESELNSGSIFSYTIPLFSS